jgi:hypothetical protein
MSTRWRVGGTGTSKPVQPSGASEVIMPAIRLRSNEVVPSPKPAIKPPSARQPRRRRAAQTEDWHIGATENQIVPTRPPVPDDDEPKQG